MASYNLFIVLAITSVTATMASNEFWVGGPKGWDINVDYKVWAADKVFRVGDSLVFNYTQGAHNVFKVNGTGFTDCIKPPSNEALTTGHDIVTLASTGSKWYICGVKKHCSDFQQRLVINVEEAPEVPAPAPAPAPVSSAQGIFASLYQVFLVAALALGITAVM